MPLSNQLFQLMLRAYPREFRLEYGSEMTQLFRDCQRDIRSEGFVTTSAFWLRIILDVIHAAPRERWETLIKDGDTMNNLKRDAIGLFACLAIIVVAFVIFGYGRKHEVSSILVFGAALDAIVTTGVVSTLVIFPLLMLRRMSTFRAVVWTLVVVHAALLVTATFIGSFLPRFSFATVLGAYLVSLFFWVTIHWLRSKIGPTSEPAV